MEETHRQFGSRVSGGRSPQASERERRSAENAREALDRERPPTRGNVHVWLRSRWEVARCLEKGGFAPEGLLTPGDTQALAQTLHPDAAAARRAARLLLRALLTSLYGPGVGRAEFVFGAHGKPSLQGNAELPPEGIDFSLSHSGHWVAVAISSAGTVGVDVEDAPCDADRAARLAPRILDPVAMATFSTLPSDRRAAFFLAQWASREALLKRGGEGLTRDPRTLLIPAFSTGRHVVTDAGGVTFLGESPALAVAADPSATAILIPFSRE